MSSQNTNEPITPTGKFKLSKLKKFFIGYAVFLVIFTVGLSKFFSWQFYNAPLKADLIHNISTAQIVEGDTYGYGLQVYRTSSESSALTRDRFLSPTPIRLIIDLLPTDMMYMEIFRHIEGDRIFGNSVVTDSIYLHVPTCYENKVTFHQRSSGL